MKKVLHGIIIFLMFLAVAFFGLKDTVIKNVLEKELTNSLGTNVRIYGVDYSVFKELLELKGVGVESRENDAYDIIHIGKITTKLNYKELFNKKIRVDGVDIKDVSFNMKTDRKNVMQPLINARQEVVSTNVERISDEDAKTLIATVLENYKAFLNVPVERAEEMQRARKIFLAATTPVLNRYVNYTIGSYAEKYILDIIKEYRALSNNIQMWLKEASNMEWSVEIGYISLSTNLFGREFSGMVSEISTDKTKSNKAVTFSLNSLLGGETGKIEGNINLYKMQGKITTEIENVDITQVKEITNYVRGMAFLEQEIILDGDKIKISGEVDVKNIILNKENIVKEFLDGNVDSLDKITGNVSDRIGNMEVLYKYDPDSRTITIDSDIAEEIGIYMGADVSELKKLERELKEKYGDQFKEGKKKLKNKLDEFLKSF